MSEIVKQNTLSTAGINRPRVLSGMRPTGRLHLGNYMGALHNWVKLQHEYECYFFIADFHALTTDYADTSRLKQNVYDIALDFLAAGLDPEMCTIFVQSHVPQHAELHLLLSMITPLSWLERVPTYKDQQEQLKEKDLATYGFLGYPLLQSADILLYKPQWVPVGHDQIAHVELTREVARRFNLFYPGFHEISPGAEASLEGTPHPILPEPECLLTPSPKLPGTDGRKMSKSYGNTILMADPASVVLEKTHKMSNGGQRPTQHDPGDPEICPVGDLHRVFSTPEVDAHIRHGCVTATIRCDECKFLVGNSVGRVTHPIFHRRMELENDPEAAWRVLERGSEKARERAEQTMREVRAAIGISRDRSGIRGIRANQEGEIKDVRSLSLFKHWWNLKTAVLIDNLREYWGKEILPTRIVLKQDTAEGVWLTGNKRRVFVAAAREGPASREWFFEVKPKSYEVLVLLCWGRDGHLHDFVVPQKMYVAPWTAAKRAAGKDMFVFRVIHRDSQYLLQLPQAEGIDITTTEADYSVIES